jgi:hypothetical protein
MFGKELNIVEFLSDQILIRCVRNTAPIGIRSSNSPARSQSLCGLSYPGPYILEGGYESYLLTPWSRVLLEKLTSYSS